ncbi:EAL domain-containing protein [Chitinibacter bivalviorum]|uniref:EAL domain-containing protein n=1 Tax=Chitinibacter bivalviorum TaxID=2739434 RepID=A0A7H9BLU2_9NEIS|nr:EAL domain-containing protein [Chitinibacter bivalviorum]QLG89647.1 EAL domain-containing protein [Chitinibacter bivalviorum]
MKTPFFSSDSTTQYIRQKRLGAFIGITMLAIAFSLIEKITSQQKQDAWILGATFVLIGVAYLIARRGRYELAATSFALTLTAMIATIHWTSKGIYDPAMLAYPAIIVFTGLLCAPWLFVLQCAIIMLNMSLLVLAEVQGWRHSTPSHVGLGYWIDMSLIMSTIAISVGLIMKDFRLALRALQIENLRVSNSQKEIEFLATHDALTHLPNRVLARDRCSHALDLAQRNQQSTALIFIDLDNFKTINDSLGHAAGDQLLVEMAQRLRHCVRQSDTVSRQGGDEFLIILEQIGQAADAIEITQKVIHQISQPLQLGHLNITATCSVGIALANSAQDDFDSLLQRADMAMYRAKASGRNTFCLYNSSMDTKATEQLHLESKMREALGNSEFTLHYQPQFDLQSGQIIGAEALVRWRHPELGLVPPGKFIPVAENSGLIVEMGEWIVFEACRQAKEWQSLGLGNLVMGINISPIQFRRGDVEQLVTSALNATGLAPELIELELTESLLLEDSQHLKVILRNLRQLGLRFSIDDFGTGYSNLSYLKHFEVERLKIDQSFIRRLTEDAHDEAIVRAIIQVANSLKLQLIAEGIEDQASLTRLIELGCEQGQGYLWSPALPADEFQQFVIRHQTSRAS